MIESIKTNIRNHLNQEIKVTSRENRNRNKNSIFNMAPY